MLIGVAGLRSCLPPLFERRGKMIGDFYGDGNRYRGVTSCDPETKSYTIIGGDMDNNTMREFWENQIKDANNRIAALEAENEKLKKFNERLIDEIYGLQEQLEITKERMEYECDRLEAENRKLKGK